jgi:hypothetical protein
MSTNHVLITSFCIIGCHFGVNASQPYDVTEESFLLPQRPHQYGSLNEEKDSKKSVTKQNQVSKNFSKKINELTKAFENFDSLSAI